jgi:hypothetical protein
MPTKISKFCETIKFQYVFAGVFWGDASEVLVEFRPSAVAVFRIGMAEGRPSVQTRLHSSRMPRLIDGHHTIQLMTLQKSEYVKGWTIHITKHSKECC